MNDDMILRNKRHEGSFFGGTPQDVIDEFNFDGSRRDVQPVLETDGVTVEIGAVPE